MVVSLFLSFFFPYQFALCFLKYVFLNFCLGCLPYYVFKNKDLQGLHKYPLNLVNSAISFIDFNKFLTMYCLQGRKCCWQYKYCRYSINVYTAFLKGSVWFNLPFSYQQFYVPCKWNVFTVDIFTVWIMKYWLSFEYYLYCDHQYH